MQEDLTILVQNITKTYRLYKNHSDRVKEAFHPFNKKYHTAFDAIKNVSFEVRAGETFGIIGRNGSGKSTLLQIICRILEPTNGSIEVKGRIGAILDLGAGFNPEYTGRQNVFMKAAILGYKQDEIKNRFHDIESFADIGEFIDQPVKMYSSGMYLRLAFAIATSIDAEVLVIDEALAVGDIFFRQRCYRRLEELRKKGVAIVLVSHAMTEVEQFCNRALLLNHGKAYFLGSANEAVKTYYLIDQNQCNEFNATAKTSTVLKSSSPAHHHEIWPNSDAFIDITNSVQISNGWAKCTAVGICDGNYNPCSTFRQGDTARFFYEFELLRNIEVPIGGIVLHSDKGVIVHGKSTLEYGSDVPMQATMGDRVRFEQKIDLEIAVGEYSFEVGLATISAKNYNNIKKLTHDELNTKFLRLCNLPSVGSFAIIFRNIGNSVQLLHHGIANLRGDCKVTVLNQIYINKYDSKQHNQKE